MSGGATNGDAVPLTEREPEVLSLVAAGSTNRFGAKVLKYHP